MTRWIAAGMLCLLPLGALAQDAGEPQTFEVRAEVTVVETSQLEPETETYQVLEVRVITEGPYASRTFTVDSRESLLKSLRHPVRAGDKVMLAIVELENGETRVFLTDVVRTGPLGLLAILFVAVTLAVGRRRGLASLAGLVGSMAVLFGFILPQLLAGRNPLGISLVGSAVILCIAIFGSHGWRRESMAAFAATVAGLGVTGILASLFTVVARLSGLSGEDAAILQFDAAIPIDFQGLLLAGIILGAVGVLDDVCITQAETVFELKKVNPALPRAELFQRALRVGRHHIASVVNTLVLAYAGASLPLLMLFYVSHQPVGDLLNAEFLAEEIVRTLVGTIGLILTVPLATWFASVYATKK